MQRARDIATLIAVLLAGGALLLSIRDGAGRQGGRDRPEDGALARVEERLASIEERIARVEGAAGEDGASLADRVQAIEEKVARIEEDARDGGPAEETERRDQLSIPELLREGAKGDGVAARWTLGERGTDEAAQAILKEIRRTDLDPGIRAHYVEIFAEKFDPARYSFFVPLLVELAGKGNPERLRGTAFERLTKLPGDAGRPAAVETIGDPDSSNSSSSLFNPFLRAVLFLEEKGRPEDIPAIEAAEKMAGDEANPQTRTWKKFRLRTAIDKIRERAK